MVTMITKDLGYFAASHNLTQHDGGCWNLHGHNYGVKVTLIGRVRDAKLDDPMSGMIVDFTMIKDVYKKHVHDVVDHAHILGDAKPSWYWAFYNLYKDAHKTSPMDTQQHIDSMLGKVAHLPIPETTAEHLARWIYDEMRNGLADLIQTKVTAGLIFDEIPRVYSVSVSETESSIATYVDPDVVWIHS